MMPTMPPDSHKISLKIIEAIRQHPVLYVSEVKGNTVKVQEFRQRVWRKISDELSLDPTWVRLKWKNLRDTYCRILKYKNKTDKGARRKKWIFEDHLSFLKFPYESGYQPQRVELTEEYIREIERSGASVGGAESLLEQLEEKNEQDYSEYLEVLEETTADPVLADGARDSGRSTTTTTTTTTTGTTTTTTVAVRETPDTVDVFPRRQSPRTKYRKIMPKKVKTTDYSKDIGFEGANESDGIPNRRDSKNSRLNFVENCGSFSTTGTSVVPDSQARNEDEDDEELGPDSASATTDLRNEGQIPSSASIGKTSIELFFNSMAQTVKLLPVKAQVEIKMAVCKIVTEAEVRYSRKKLLRNTQKFIAPPGMIPKLVLIPCSTIDDPNGKN